MSNVKNADFTTPDDPWALFGEWFAMAESHEVNDANAMSVATVGGDGMPAVRILLMKGYDSSGFTFFTNRQSRKGEEILGHPRVGICFHWKSLRRQVRAEGEVRLVSDAESDSYFASRPRGSQIGAWASQQSRPLANREELVQRVAEFEKLYEGKAVPRPPHWGGYRLVPRLIEFWQDREFRLHDRFVYQRANEQSVWTIERLNP